MECLHDYAVQSLHTQTVLAGDRSATTNKGAWKWATAQGPKTAWALEARWVVDGPVWTSAGVTAGQACLSGSGYSDIVTP